MFLLCYVYINKMDLFAKYPIFNTPSIFKSLQLTDKEYFSTLCEEFPLKCFAQILLYKTFLLHALIAGQYRRLMVQRGEERCTCVSALV